MTASSDFIIQNHGSIFLLHPQTPTAGPWVGQYIDEPILTAEQVAAARVVPGLPSYSNRTLDDIVSLTPGRRRRGKNVDRRRGQKGQVFQKGWCRGKKWDPEASAYLRYLVDVPGQEERKLKCVTLGKFRTLTLAEQAAQEYVQANGVNDRQVQEQSIISLTFRQQADRFLTASIDPARRGGPVAQATYDFWRGAIDTWLNPLLGDLQLADVGNAQARKLIDAMRAAKRSDKTIVEYVCIMKSIVASAVDGEGEQLFPRQWNHDFMRLPIVDKTKQRRPKVTDKEWRQS